MKEKDFRLAEAFMKVPAYRPYFDILEESPLAKVRPINTFDIINLGKQFRQFENYRKMVNETTGTLRDLGQLPTYAYDVITANYAASIIPLLSSVQPIPGQQGLVYFKKIKARTTRGTVTDGQTLRDATSKPDVQAVGFAGEHVFQNLGTLVAAQQSYNFNLTPAPIRERTTIFSISNSSATLRDDGNGNIYPVGGALATGTINYQTGFVTINFIPVIAGTETLRVEFGTEFEENGNIPTIQSTYDTTEVKAEVFSIRSEMGLLKMYELKKTYGKDGEAEMINDLTQEINAELGNTMISRLAAASFGTPISWDSAAEPGVSEVEHKLAFKNRIAEASSKIYRAAGRGQTSVMICGAVASQLFDQLGGLFEPTGFASSGPTLYGMYNKNIPVIRAIDVIPDNAVFCVYKGTTNFDAPMVYCPYMPLIVNGSLPVLNNVLKHQGFAAVWSAMKVIVPRFITQINIQSLV